MMGTSVAMSAGRLFDEVQQLLGIGDAGEEEWSTWRTRQVSMLKKMMTRRGVTSEQVLLCAEYAQSHRLQPATYAGLLRLLPDAEKWGKSRFSEDVDDRISKAIEWEQALSDEESEIWISRFLRATDREAVLAEWARVRQ